MVIVLSGKYFRKPRNTNIEIEIIARLIVSFEWHVVNYVFRVD